MFWAILKPTRGIAQTMKADSWQIGCPWVFKPGSHSNLASKFLPKFLQLWDNAWGSGVSVDVPVPLILSSVLVLDLSHPPWASP